MSFWLALQQEKPLQIVGTINAYAARLAQKTGYKALYLSGAGVANASFGIPDIGGTTLQNVLEDARRITGITALPLLVDVDTGWNIPETVKSMIQAGVAAIHIEDQVAEKRCGHLSGKQVVSSKEMEDRIKAAVDARTNSDFVIMARTDAIAIEGLAAGIDRANAYLAAGADMIFAEAITELSDYTIFTHSVSAPVLANITEFGVTPLFTREQLKQAGLQMILYPLSAFRAMNAAALQVYQTIRAEGTQQTMVPLMQTRKELYDFLDYEDRI